MTPKHNTKTSQLHSIEEAINDIRDGKVIIVVDDENRENEGDFLAAAEKSGLELFLGSYPITPATDILHELVKHKHFGVKAFQAEDEIAGISSAIGAPTSTNISTSSATAGADSLFSSSMI